MVVIRLSRHGAKKRPFYKINVIDNRKARDGRPIENIGFFNPLAKSNEEKIRIKTDRFDYWKNNGASVSQRVNSIHLKFAASNTSKDAG